MKTCKGIGEMKRTSSPAKPATVTTHQPSDPLNLLKRIRLEFLDEYVCEKRGYDPYDTSKGRVPDAWAAKRKRA
jgi:hypothetical protein